MIMEKPVTFTIKCTMKSRWVPHFLAMLRYMSSDDMGCSRKVALLADGDGDFNPEFEWDSDLPCEALPRYDDDGDRLYDAG
jgi:hypothetical protein